MRHSRWALFPLARATPAAAAQSAYDIRLFGSTDDFAFRVRPVIEAAVWRRAEKASAIARSGRDLCSRFTYINLYVTISGVHDS